MKSLFFNILNAFILIILLTVFLSTGIEFLITRERLPKMLTEVRTKNIAYLLGASYSQKNGWDTLSDEILWAGEHNTYQKNVPSIRIIIRDTSGKTLYNSFSQISILRDSPLVEGGAVPVLDFRTGEVVGTVTAYLDKNYLDKETVDYIISILKSRLLQGGITILVALLAAFFLSRRILRPITALTDAAEVISQKEDPPLLPIESQDELGKMSQSFNRMIRSLEHQRELRKRLIGDVSHEILTPLNHIRLEAKGILDGITFFQQGVPRIIKEVDQMKNLVHDLDWLAETDSGEYKLKREMISLEKIISREIEIWTLKGAMEKKEVIFKGPPSELPLFYVDPARIRQALGNLIDNAFKYSFKKSSVEVRFSFKKGMAVISVKDQSNGIPSEDKPYLFERFYRADTVRTPDKGGRGLGLSIAKQIVELHGGRVWFSSRVNSGSTFFMSIPYQDYLSPENS